MLILTVVIFYFSSSQCVAENSDMGLAGEAIKQVAECAVETKVNYGICLEMFNKDAVLTDNKFNSCKCMISCVGKKMNLMSSDGKFMNDEILKLIENLQAQEIKEEAKKLQELCKNVEGADCDAGLNKAVCIFKNSEKAKQITILLVKTLAEKE